MRLIAIDTGGAALSVAIADERGVIVAGGQMDGRQHSLGLLPLTKELLDGCGAALADMDAFAVTVGPGSFTGLRIGVATVKAWADALRRPLIAVSSTEAQARTVAIDGYSCPVFDARRDEVYTALFKDGGRLLPDLALSPDDLAKILSEYDAPILFSGDGLPRYGGRLQELLGERFRAVEGPDSLYMAKAAAELACAKFAAQDFIPGPELLPLYLRPSEAEEKRLAALREDGHEG